MLAPVSFMFVILPEQVFIYLGRREASKCRIRVVRLAVTGCGFSISIVVVASEVLVLIFLVC